MTETEALPPEIEALRARADELERQLTLIKADTDQKLIRAELKAEAVRAGIVDLDGLKLLDVSGAKMNERGEVEGGAQMIAGLKRGKPWLFSAVSSSSSATAPTAAPPRQKLASEMTEAEYRVARAELIRRR